MILRKRTTLRDVAKAVGVTPMVVSEVLNGRTDRIGASAATREKIFKAATKLEYRPNSFARGIRQKRFHNIGCLNSPHSITAYTVSSINTGICDEASAQNYRVVLIAHGAGWQPKPEEVPSIYQEAHLDTMIVNNYFSQAEAIKSMLAGNGLPLVFLNEKRPENAVYFDDLKGGRLATEHLLERGFRRIAFAAGVVINPHYSLQDRHRGYLAAMKAAGLPTESLIVPNNELDINIVDWLRKTEPEAVVCYTDSIAFHVQRALHILGRRSPEDLAIVGFNGETLAVHSPVPLTTMRLPFYAMARAATDMAIRLVDQPSGTFPSIVFQPELVVDESSERRPARKKRR